MDGRRVLGGGGARALLRIVAGDIATTIVFTDWTGAFARSWFWLHRGEFVAAEQLTRSGALGAPETWDYYGVELPFGLRALSVDGHISEIGRAGGAPVLFVPAYMGIPDDAYGFVHLVGAVEGGDLDGYGDPIEPRIPLGNGWWWADSRA